MSSKLLQILGCIFVQKCKDAEPPDQHNWWYGVARSIGNHTIEWAPRLRVHREPVAASCTRNRYQCSKAYYRAWEPGRPAKYPAACRAVRRSCSSWSSKLGSDHRSSGEGVWSKSSIGQTNFILGWLHGRGGDFWWEILCKYPAKIYSICVCKCLIQLRNIYLLDMPIGNAWRKISMPTPKRLKTSLMPKLLIWRRSTTRRKPSGPQNIRNMNRQHIPCKPRLGTRGKRRVKLLKTLIPWPASRAP
jgi:hypothetical protein